MKFVSEKAIDAIIDYLDTLNEDQYEEKMEAFASAQPVVISYLFNEACRNLGTLLQLQMSPSKPLRPPFFYLTLI